MGRYKHQRKVNATSVINVKKRMLAEERGEFWNDRQPWTSEQDDTLLDGWLCYNWPITSPNRKTHTFQKVMGRTKDSVETRLTKLATRYNEAGNYLPEKRKDRTGEDFSTRELYLLELATDPKGAGWVRQAHHPVNLAKLLGRSEEDIRKRLKKLAGTQQTLFSTIPIPKETEEDKIARLVHKVIKRLLHNIGEAIWNAL